MALLLKWMEKIISPPESNEISHVHQDVLVDYIFKTESNFPTVIHNIAESTGIVSWVACFG